MVIPDSHVGSPLEPSRCKDAFTNLSVQGCTLLYTVLYTALYTPVYTLLYTATYPVY